jgi:hypothetical protein
MARSDFDALQNQPLPAPDSEWKPPERKPPDPRPKRVVLKVQSKERGALPLGEVQTSGVALVRYLTLGTDGGDFPVISRMPLALHVGDSLVISVEAIDAPGSETT